MIPSAVYQWAIAAAIAGVIGLTLAVLGLRGKRVGTQPFCARCGFDLSGTIGATAAAATAMPCPECGADITARRAVRLGVRKRSALFTAVGLVVLLGGTSGAGWMAYSAVKGVALIPTEPTWLLMAQSDGILGQATPALLGALLAREKAGTLADSDLRTLVKRALVAQADMGRAWDTQWGDFVAAAHVRGLTTDAQCQQFMKGAVTLSVLTRERVRVRTSTNLKWMAIPARGPSPTWPNKDGVLVRELRGSCTVSRDGKTLDSFDPSNFLRDSDNGRFGYECDGSSSMAHSWDLPPGLYDLTMDGRVRVGFRHMQFTDPGWAVTVSRKATLTLTPADQPTVRAVADKSLAQQLQSDLRLQIFTHTNDQWDSRTNRMVATPTVALHIERKNPAASLAFSGCIRESGHPLNPRTWPFENVQLDPGLNGSGFQIMPAIGFDCPEVDVVFRTSLIAAELSPTVSTVWDGEVVFENVKVATGPWIHNASSPTVLPASVQSPAPPAAVNWNAGSH